MICEIPPGVLWESQIRAWIEVPRYLEAWLSKSMQMTSHAPIGNLAYSVGGNYHLMKLNCCEIEK